MRETQFDLFVIGGGSGGVRAARTASALGARVGLAEGDRLGGTCVIRGCVPKKLFAYASRFSDQLEQARAFGWSIPTSTFDWEKFKSLRDVEIDRLESIYANLLSRSEVEYFSQLARLVGPGEVQLQSGKRVTASNILIATGGMPSVPTFEGSHFALTSNDIFTLPKAPEDVIVIGGGYIALEFATIFRGLGIATALVYRGDRLLRTFDSSVSEITREGLEFHGVTVRFNSNPSRLSQISNDRYRLELTNGDILEAEYVIAATGRVARAQSLGLSSVGIRTDSAGAISVDRFDATGADGIYAIGDVTNRINLTPVAIREGELLARRLFSDHTTVMDYRNVPSAVFTDPEIGTCGLSEQAAVEKGYSIRVFSNRFYSMDTAFRERRMPGLIKLIVDRENDKVLGVHIVGLHASDMIQMVAVAMRLGVTKADFDATIAVHPTFAEELVTLR